MLENPYLEYLKKLNEALDNLVTTQMQMIREYREHGKASPEIQDLLERAVWNVMAIKRN